MEITKPLNCQFGQHINSMEKEKLVHLCHQIYKDEPLDELQNLEEEDLINKYQSAWMENFNQLQ
ncbi:MAG: hypothetical protein M3421_07945 [Bacteroidota bacterium]|jgi:hypothetical protein|nr:hypothetical protein [Bacteroidota bacterium]